MRDQDKFLKHINDNYNLLKNKYRKFCQEKLYDWDEDVFSDTILKCYEAIERKGKLEDTTNQGFENYFFRSFKQNIQREKQYCRVSKRDLNIKDDNIHQLYEEWYNYNKDSSSSKIKSDLFKDFAVLYLMKTVEDNFDTEHFFLFKLKSLIPDMTYKKLQEKTNVKGTRQKVVDVKNWLKDNVKKDDVRKAFYQMYGNLL